MWRLEWLAVVCQLNFSGKSAIFAVGWWSRDFGLVERLEIEENLFRGGEAALDTRADGRATCARRTTGV